jgi:hypothetical protein
MGLNGNRFKLSEHSKPCPECLGYPPLKLSDGRLRPECKTCDGAGSVPNVYPRQAPPTVAPGESQPP